MSKLQKLDLTRYYSGNLANLVWQKNGRVRTKRVVKKRRPVVKSKK